MKYQLLFLMITFFLIVTCSTSKPPKDKGPNSKTQQSSMSSIESKEIASEEKTPFVTEIVFSRGGTEISPKAREEIKQLLHKAQLKGHVKEAKIITWADQEYPSVHTKELTKRQQKLVEDRNNHLKKLIDKLDKSIQVEKYSMATRPGTIKELMETDDSRIKTSLEKAGIPNTDTTVKVPGKASKSIIMFLMDEK